MAEQNNDTKSEQSVFMCLDVNTYSFSSSTYGNTKGVVICALFTVGYWTLGFAMMDILMSIMDTIHRWKPFLRLLLVYLLILQKLVRVFVIHEKQMVREYQEQTHNNLAKLSDFYTIKASGYDKVTKVDGTGREQTFARVRYRNNSEDYFMKFLRGSLTSEYVDTENSQIKFTCNYLNTLMSQNIIPRIIISDEHVERLGVFRFYQKRLRKTDLSPECIQLCNDTLLYHEYTAGKYSRITATYYDLGAITAKQKTFLETFVKNYTFSRQGSSFRNVVTLSKREILALFKDINGLNAINEQDLQTSDAIKRVPLGLTKTILVRNTITGEEIQVNKPDVRLRLDISKINYEMLPKTTEINQSTKPHEDFLNQEPLNERQPEDFLNQEPINNTPQTDLFNRLEQQSESDLKTANTELDIPDLPDIDIIDGVLDFNAATQGMSSINKSVLLMNHIKDDSCTIVL